MDPFGNKEDNVGFFKFVKYMTRAVPGALRSTADGERNSSQGGGLFRSSRDLSQQLSSFRSASGDFIRGLRKSRADSRKEVVVVPSASTGV